MIDVSEPANSIKNGQIVVISEAEISTGFLPIISGIGIIVKLLTIIPIKIKEPIKPTLTPSSHISSLFCHHIINWVIWAPVNFKFRVISACFRFTSRSPFLLAIFTLECWSQFIKWKSRSKKRVYYLMIPN